MTFGGPSDNRQHAADFEWAVSSGPRMTTDSPDTTARAIFADALRRFVEQVFLRIGYSDEEAADATDVLLWASLRGVDTHGIRNLKSYYVDRTRAGMLKPRTSLQIENQAEHSASIDGNSGLGLA